MSSGMIITDEFGNPVSEEISSAVLEAMGGSVSAADPFGGFMESANVLAAGNPVDILSGVILAIGIVTLIGGIVLAVLLRKWGQANR